MIYRALQVCLGEPPDTEWARRLIAAYEDFATGTDKGQLDEDRRLLRGIVEVAPRWMTKEIQRASQHGGDRVVMWLS